MVNLINVAYGFQLLSLILIILILSPQAYLNYRLKNTDNLSTATIILWIISTGVQVTYLIWSHQLPIIFIAYGVYLITALFIACQISYYQSDDELLPLTNSSTKFSLLKKRLRFLLNFLIGLILLVIYGISLYSIFELTQFSIWMPRLIGTIVPVGVDSLSYIPQIILILRMKTAVGVSLLSIMIEMNGAIFSLISVCLQENIDMVPLITFLNILLFQIIMLFLKLYYSLKARLEKDKKNSSELKNDNNLKNKK